MESVVMLPGEILVPSLVHFTSRNSLSGEFRPHRVSVKHITRNSFTNATSDAKSLYLEFGHDTSILLPLSTMGLNKSVPSRVEVNRLTLCRDRDALPLNPRHMTAHRRFRTSQQTPFAATMVWEKFTCKKSCVKFSWSIHLSLPRIASRGHRSASC